MPSITEKLQSGKSICGVISSIASPAVAEMLALAGFDFVLLDLEHGPMTFETLENCVRGVILGGSIPFARVPENNAKLILRALDTGVTGIMVPQVTTLEELDRCVQAVRYAPEGGRSLSLSTRAAQYGMRDMNTHIDRSNREAILMPQLESAQACENVESFLTIEGVDAYFVGPADLSQSIGFPGEVKHPKVQNCISNAIKTCKAANMPVGITVSTPKQLTDMKEAGVQIFTPVFQNLTRDAARMFLSESCHSLDR